MRNKRGENNLLKNIITITLIAICALVLFGCGKNSKQDKVEISFDCMGGSEISSISIESGKSLSELVSPIKNDVVFDNWYLEEDYQTKWTPDYKFENDTTLYAKYLVKVSYLGLGVVEDSYMYLDEGELVDEFPLPNTPEMNFNGWFLNAEGQDVLDTTKPLFKNTTLYARFSEVESGEIYSMQGMIFDEIPNNFSFTIVGNIDINKTNFRNYIDLYAQLTELPELEFKHNGNITTILPASGNTYVEGETYFISLLDDSLSFGGDYSGYRSFNFKIKITAETAVEIKESVKRILWKDVAVISDWQIFIVHGSEISFVKDDALMLWNGEINKDTVYYKVAEVEPQTLYNPESNETLCGSLIKLTECDINDIFDEYNVNYVQQIDNDKVLKVIDLDAVKDTVINSPQMESLANILADSIIESPTFMSMLGYSFEDGISDREYQVKRLAIKLAKGISVKVKTGSCKNSNFDGFENQEWAMLYIDVTFKTTFDKVKIKAEMNLSVYLYYYIMGTTFDISDITEIKSKYMNYSLNMLSQIGFDFSVLVCSTNSGNDLESGIKDITPEINKMLQNSDNDEGRNNIVEKVQEMLKLERNYIDLFEVNFYEQSVFFPSPIPVADLSIDLSFVVKVNFAAGLNLDFSVLSGQRYGIKGSINDGFDPYSNSIQGRTRYEISLAAYGYTGVKAGIRGRMGLSIIGFGWLGDIYLSLEGGVYMDLYGFVEFSIKDNSQWVEEDPKWSLNGSVYFEAGVYFECNIGAYSEYFKAKAEINLVDLKFKLFGFGSKYMFVEMITKEVVMRESEFDLKNNLIAKFFDITTGEEVKLSLSDVNNFYAVPLNIGSTKMFNYNSNTGKMNFSLNNINNPISYRLPSGEEIFINQQTKYVSTKVYIRFSLAGSFSIGTGKINSEGDIILHYIDKDVTFDGELSKFKGLKARCIADIDGERVILGEQQVFYGGRPELVNYDKYMGKYYVKDYGNYKPLGLFEQMTEDTDFIIYFSIKKYLVTFEYFNGQEDVKEMLIVSYNTTPVFPEAFKTPRTDTFYDGYDFKIDSEHRFTSYPADRELTSLIHPLDNRGGYPFTYFYHYQCDNNLIGQTIPYDENKNNQFTIKANYTKVSYEIKYVYNPLLYLDSGCKNVFITTQKALLNAWYYAPYEFSGLSFIGYTDVEDSKEVKWEKGETLPEVKKEATYYAVYELKNVTVRILDSLGNTIEEREVRAGSKMRMDDITYPPLITDENITRVFLYRSFSFQGKLTIVSDSTEITVIGDCVIAPVYTDYTIVNIDMNGGKLNSKYVSTILLNEGTYETESFLFQFVLGRYGTIAPPESYDYTYTIESLSLNGEKITSFKVGKEMVNLTINWKAERFNNKLIVYTDIGTLPQGLTGGTYTDDKKSWIFYGILSEIKEISEVMLFDKKVSLTEEEGEFMFWNTYTFDTEKQCYVINGVVIPPTIEHRLTFYSGEGNFYQDTIKKTYSLKYYEQNVGENYISTSEYYSDKLIISTLKELEICFMDQKYEYGFYGWKLEGGTICRNVDDSLLKENEVNKLILQPNDMFVVAVFAPIKKRQYEYTFFSSGGFASPYEDKFNVKVTGSYGDKLEIPTPKQRVSWMSPTSGYSGIHIFTGWNVKKTDYTDKVTLNGIIGGSEYDQILLTSPTVYVDAIAIYELNPIKVNFYIDDSLYITQVMYPGFKLTMPDLQLGYNQIFVGWFKSFDNGVMIKVDDITIYTQIDELTFYGYIINKNKKINVSYLLPDESLFYSTTINGNEELPHITDESIMPVSSEWGDEYRWYDAAEYHLDDKGDLYIIQRGEYF